MTLNPYAPPQSMVGDVSDPRDTGTPAGRGARLLASILDGIIVGAMVYLPYFVGLLIGFVAFRDSSGMQLLIAGTFCFAGLVVWATMTYKGVAENGQSLGKRAMAIKVVRADGSPVSVSRIFWLRNVVNTLIGIVPLYGVVDVLFIFSESRRTLHDRIADTIVICA